MFTIKCFWQPRLTATSSAAAATLPGWRHVTEPLPTFVEAPMHTSSGFGNTDPRASGVILVSAPGAVGKSTLARQIAYQTGAMLLDLAEANPVGANTLVGGLARLNLYQHFRQGTASLVIDGLDEARMQVTQDGFAAFLDDVVLLSDSNCKPLVLFGRTGAIQETWLLLSEQGIEPPVLEIGYFDEQHAAEFAKIQVQHIREESTRREPDGRAVDLILSRLREETSPDGGTFAGYSPVLIAVAKQVADPSDDNTQALISRIESGGDTVTLASVIESILDREQKKIENLRFNDSKLRNELYGPEEQFARLIGRIYHGAPLPHLPNMSPEDQKTYSDALTTWVQEHPFLDGTGENPSSAVFGGILAVKALFAPSISDAVLNKELGQGTLINPFIAEFYISELSARNASHPVTPSAIRAGHVGLLYASVRARLS